MSQIYQSPADVTSPFRSGEELVPAHAPATGGLVAEPEVPAEMLAEYEAASAQSARFDFDTEVPARPAAVGQSSVAIQAAKQWDGVDRPAGWIGRVFGLVVHTTGGGLPASAKEKDVYHTVRAVDYYTKSHGCHYVNGWRGIAGGDLLQLANEREQANGVGVGEQRNSIAQGRFEKDLPPVVVAMWRARWPGLNHSLELLPKTRTANSCYVHVECVPCVFHYRGRLVTDAEPMRPGLRFTRAQHEAVAHLACDIARRNGWPLQQTWWRSARLVGHEDLTPLNRFDKFGGWDPGGLRAKPYFDWDFVYQLIEKLCPRSSASSPIPATSEYLDPEDEASGLGTFSEADDEGVAMAVGPELAAIPPEGEDEDPESETFAPGTFEDLDESAYEESLAPGDVDRLIAGGLGGPFELDEQVEGLASTMLEPFRVATAIAGGQRDANALTNAVFFARHPELAGRQLRQDETALADEWVRIRDSLVRPLLARSSTAATATPSGSPDGGPEGPLGTLTLAAPGRRALSYPFTAADAVWTAKLVTLEAGGTNDLDNAAVIWAMFNRYALFTHTRYRTFTAFIRAYSTTLQPTLVNPQAAARHMNSTEFVPSGGTFPGTNIPRGQLRRHLSFQAKPWSELAIAARAITLDAMRGTLPNPGIGLASEFASTRILWRQANRTTREPTDAEWRSFTTAYAARRETPAQWIGDVPGINQRKNAFFIHKSVAALPPTAVTVTP